MKTKDASGLATGGVAGEVVIESQGGGSRLAHRAAPMPDLMSTMRMEDMLRAAMTAAAGDEAKVREFDEVLGKYKAHPGVLRREREEKAARAARHEELNRPAYDAERRRLPERLTLAMKTAEAIVDGTGCEWELADEIARFPILKFVRATAAELESMPILETLQYHIDRKMGEQQARAVLYALPARFKQDKKQSALSGGKGYRQEWLETQHRIFDEIEGAGFAPPPRPTPTKAPAELGAGPRRPSPAAPPGLEAIVERRASRDTIAPLADLNDVALELAPTPAVGGGGGAAGAAAAPPATPAMTPCTAASAEVLGSQLRRSATTPARASYAETSLETRIGQGTYGSVFRGRCGDVEVAVKVMALQADTAEDIKREIKIMRECECEHIVAYLDAFIRQHEMRSTLWVVMEYCALGSTLDMMRRQGAALDEGVIQWVVASVLRGLEYMHTERKAIHRDMKAANVLITAAGDVKLADLGVAAQLFNTMSKRGTMIGTPHWMAPETLGQLADDGKYDAKVDVWGLGITAIELAQMGPPFAETKQIFKVMMAIVNGPPPTLPESHAASPLFRDFLAAALVKDAADRPSCAALLTHPFVTAAEPGGLRLLAADQAEGLRNSGGPAAAAERKESNESVQLEATRVL